MSIPIVRPTIKRPDMDSVLTCLVSDQLKPGEQNRVLIEQILDLTGYEGGVALRDPQVAAELALASSGLQPGAKVGISVLAPGYYYASIKRLGFEAALIDPDPRSGMLSLEEIRRVFEAEGFAALVLTEVCGALYRFETGELPAVVVIEDRSRSIGAAADEVTDFVKPEYILVSMEPEDLLTAGGGALVIARGKKEAKALGAQADLISPTAYLSDMNAALGKTQVKELRSFSQKRRDLYEVLSGKALQARHKLPTNPEPFVPGSFILDLETSVAEVSKYALKHGVETRQVFEGSIFRRLSVSKDHDGLQEFVRRFPNAARINLRWLEFPLYPSLNSKELERLAKVVTTLP